MPRQFEPFLNVFIELRRVERGRRQKQLKKNRLAGGTGRWSGFKLFSAAAALRQFVNS
jgi:hypothetical protein